MAKDKKTIKEEMREESIRRLVRDIMTGIQLEDAVQNFQEELDATEYRTFCQYCYDTYNSPFWKAIKKHLVLNQLVFSTLHATDYLQTTFGRANINGISLWDELFEKFANEYVDKYLPKEDSENFDEGKSFNETSTG